MGKNQDPGSRIRNTAIRICLITLNPAFNLLFYADPDADPDQTFQTDAFRILIQIKLFTLMRIRIQKIVSRDSKLLIYEKIISYSLHFGLTRANACGYRY
jgi:hypothetical protein